MNKGEFIAYTATKNDCTKIKAYNQPQFKVGQKLKDAVNQK